MGNWRSRFTFWAVVFAFAGVAYADTDSNSDSASNALVVPSCPAYGRDLPINNEQVIHWKRNTPNQFRERANISGKVVQVFPDTNGHEHFVIQIGKQADDTIEVIYNKDFGAMPEPPMGASVQACGDYITATARSGPYPPSPVGAIIHWVHMNPRGRGHDPGFVVMDGVLYGMDAENAGPRDRQPPRKRKPRGRGHGRSSEAANSEEAAEAVSF
jgi:hypothetical protein